MIYIQNPTLTSLINSYQKKDPVLWEILTKIYQSNSDLIAGYNQFRTSFNWIMELEIDALSVDTDLLPTWKRVYLPRDERNVQTYTQVKPQLVGLLAKSAPSGADLICDIQYSRDLGSSWNSLFQSVTTLILPDGNHYIQYGIFSAGTLFDGDIVRFDVSQTGSAAGLEIRIIGAMN